MKIIDRYLLSGFFRILFLTELSLILVYIVVDFFEKIGQFLSSQLPLDQILKFFLLMIPMIIFYITPIAILVSVMISIGLLARRSEVVAFKASGFSLYRLSAPLVVAAFGLSVFIFFLSDLVIPQTSARANIIWKIEVQRNRELSSQIRRNVWFKLQDGIFHFKVFDLGRQTIEGLSLFRFGDHFTLKERIEASRASQVNGIWVFEDGLIKKFLPDGRLEVKSFTRQNLPMPSLPEDIGQAPRAAEEMSSWQLLAWIAAMRAGGYDPLRYEVDWHMKFSYPFICFIVILIGLPIAFWKEKGGGLILGIAAGIALAFFYLVFLSLSRALGYAGLLPPVVAAWLPNLTFILLSLFLFTFVRQ